MNPCRNHTACIRQALKTAKDVCQERGIRLTDTRARILEMIWASHTPIKAYDLLDTLAQEYGSAKPPTVYRALSFLLKNGFIHKLDSQSAYVGCAHPREAHECYFLICDDCGDVAECCSADIASTIAKVAQHNTFAPTHVRLEITGRCPQCQPAL